MKRLNGGRRSGGAMVRLFGRCGRAIGFVLLLGVVAGSAACGKDQRSPTAPSSTPQVTALTPDTGVQGTAVAVRISGTGFVVGESDTVAVTGDGIEISGVRVESATAATATLTIASDAALGPRTLTVTMAGGGASPPLTFTVLPPVPELTAIAPAAATVGSTVALTLTGAHFVSGATTVAIGGGGVTMGEVAVHDGSSLTVDLTIDRAAAAGARMVTVTTAGGASAAQTFIVSMTQADIDAFTANPPRLTAGESSTLIWRGIRDATACRIEPEVGTVSCGDGRTTVTPRSTTTYTLSARGPGGTVTRSATVTVSAAPAPVIGGFTADPASLSAGQAATLAWSGISDATTCAIDGGIGAVSCAGGRRSVTPAATTTYTLTATGAGGTTTRTVTVTIEGAPAIGSFAAGPASITVGQSSTLTWAGVTEATACVIDPGVGTVSCADGSRSVTPGATTTYTLTATGAGGTATRTATVTVGAAAPTLVSVVPNAATRPTTQSVVLTGTNFAVGATAVAVSGAGVTVANVHVTSPTSLSADFVIAGTAPAGPRTVTVTTDGGAAAQTFTIAAPHGSMTFGVGTGVFAVPDGVTEITVDAFGARGGAGNTGGVPGGAGALVHATLAVTAGETLTIVGGGSGGNGRLGGPMDCDFGLGGFNGGGNGGTCQFAGGGGGGGGATAIQRGATALVVAGGGGGGAGQGSMTVGVGGAGGQSGTAGAAGSAPAGGGGSGATPTSPGLGGFGQGSSTAGTNGSAGQGGTGGALAGATGGGGGGGVFGGGGGGAAQNGTGGGGGGGSSMGPAGATFTTGANAADGRVVITW